MGIALLCTLLGAHVQSHSMLFLKNMWGASRRLRRRSRSKVAQGPSAWLITVANVMGVGLLVDKHLMTYCESINHPVMPALTILPASMWAQVFWHPPAPPCGILAVLHAHGAGQIPFFRCIFAFQPYTLQANSTTV